MCCCPPWLPTRGLGQAPCGKRVGEIMNEEENWKKNRLQDFSLTKNYVNPSEIPPHCCTSPGSPPAPSGMDPLSLGPWRVAAFLPCFCTFQLWKTNTSPKPSWHMFERWEGCLGTRSQSTRLRRAGGCSAPLCPAAGTTAGSVFQLQP